MNELINDGKKFLDHLRNDLESGKPIAIFSYTVDDTGEVASDYSTEGIDTLKLLGQMVI